MSAYCIGLDSDGDGITDDFDIDSDNDGIPDREENLTRTDFSDTTDNNNDGFRHIICKW